MEKNGTEHNRTEQNRTEQNRNEWNEMEKSRTSQNGTERNRSEQNETERFIKAEWIRTSQNIIFFPYWPQCGIASDYQIIRIYEGTRTQHERDTNF